MHEKVQFMLNKYDFSYKDIPSEYRYNLVNKHNYRLHIDCILRLTDSLYNDLGWRGAPCIDDIIDRFNVSSCLLFYYKNSCIGWIWFSESCITYDWINCFRCNNESDIYVGSAYIIKPLQISPLDGLYLYVSCALYLFSTLNKSRILWYVDDWNRASSLLSYRVGAKNLNFL